MVKAGRLGAESRKTRYILGGIMVKAWRLGAELRKTHYPFVNYLEKILPAILSGYSYAVYPRYASGGYSPTVWHIRIVGLSGKLPMGSAAEQTGLLYAAHLLSEKFGPAVLGMRLAMESEEETVEGFTNYILFQYQPDLYDMPLTQPKVGMALYGVCDGYFGRGFYEDKVIEAVDSDWVMVRTPKGLGIYCETDEWGGKIPQEWTCGETS